MKHNNFRILGIVLGFLAPGQIHAALIWQHPTPLSETIRGLAWSGTTYVAVGTEMGAASEKRGMISSSSDGLAWTRRLTYGTTNFITGVAWGKSRFVAVGDSGMILTSADGSAWEKHSIGTSDWLSQISFDGSQFIAFGQQLSATSGDGITWTTRSIPGTNYGFSASGSLTVAVGKSGSIRTSPDFTTWTTRTTATSQDLLAVAWSGSMFVAVGYSGTLVTSPDGITWTARASGVADHLFRVHWTGSQFVVTAGAGRILTSQNGTTWTIRPTVSTFSDFYAVLVAGTRTFLGGTDGMLIESSNGTTWEKIVNPVRSTMNAFALSNTSVVGVGSEGMILIRPSSSSWAAVSSPVKSALRTVVWSGSKFVAGGDSGKIITSANGRDWGLQNSTITTTINSIAWSGTKFLAVGNEAKTLISPDGITWKAYTISWPLKSVIWTGTQFVAVGDVPRNNSHLTIGAIYTSPDGITWTSRFTTPVTISSLSSLAQVNGRIVVVGASGSIYGSSDGMLWTAYTSTVPYSLASVAATSSGFVAVSKWDPPAPSVILRSSNGIDWKVDDSEAVVFLSSVSAVGEGYLFGGVYGVIYEDRNSTGTSLRAIKNIHHRFSPTYSRFGGRGSFSFSRGKEWVDARGRFIR